MGWWGADGPPPPRTLPAFTSMPHFIQQLNDTTLAVTFTGLMSQGDRVAFENAARALIAKAGRINALILLKDFEGVGRDVNMGNIDFYAQHADDIEKMAIVADPRWETQAFLFTGSGARSTDIRFFPTAQFGLAQAWLAL